jgi:hypothetical protein
VSTEKRREEQSHAVPRNFAHQSTTRGEGAAGIHGGGQGQEGEPWGSSPEFSASAESVAITAGGLVVATGFVGPGPHEFGRASNSAKNAQTHLVIPTGVVEELPTLLDAQHGHILPFDSTSLGGDDAFTLWTQR